MNETKEPDSAAGNFSCAPPSAATAANVATPILPEFIRLPRSGMLCNWTGLSRSKLNELILPCAANGLKAPVRSVCLRRKGAVKGARLINLQSLLEYLRTQSEGGETP
jgi:hypothetical protein